MNSCLNVNRLEFLVTRKCSGHCKHCSVISKNGDPGHSYADLDAVLAALSFLLNAFHIESLMTFGGEPLLYADITAALLQAATAHGVSRRELITNGYFSNDTAFIGAVVEQLLAAGVNDIKLSIDAFHQEHIPIHRVEPFIAALLSHNFTNLTVHPAWLVSQDHANDYNRHTQDLIGAISRTYGLAISRGNTVVLSGLAKEHFWSYYPEEPIDLNAPCGQMAFTNSLTDIKTLRILPNGNIAFCRAMVIGNLFQVGIDSIVRGYRPDTHNGISLLLNGGLTRLHRVAERNAGPIDLTKYRNPCDLCADCVKAIGG